MDIDKLDQLAARAKQKHETHRCKVCVCSGAGCISSGSGKTLEAVRQYVQDNGLTDSVEVIPVGCVGACNRGPLVKIEPEGVVYGGVTAENAAEILNSHAKGGVPLAERAVFSGDDGNFFRRQHKIVLENCGSIDPESIEDYIGAGGYRALHVALTKLSREEVIGELKQSRLRGRGGAGYPAGLKWEMVYRYVNDVKYVICNGDEGDPGAFMDRSILEGDPHRVLEGMIIAGYAVGARKGYLYVRAEYPLAIKRIQKAIKEARTHGLLGPRIFASDLNFEIEIRVGAGAFVCGEETALIASIEGKRGTPRPRPPYPAESGLWGRPTLINNVETFANIVPIILNGGEWYCEIGTPKSPGTKVFALAGKINNTGLIEVPMGMTLREIIFDIGGGIPGGKRFKAAQTGGPSGGCIPEQYLDTRVDYESLVSLGSIMGSGGLIVMDETSCMVDVARFFMEFCMDESCGKCVPCRVGTKQMHGLLQKICLGAGQPEHLALLEELAPYVKETSLCGLGMTAPNPLVSTLRYFRDEYEAHIRDKYCPAGVCSMEAAPALQEGR
jgi:NADH:ubiquinone oxidoreductase subunit F (NADH-binding)/(2Fe-2S) ferredoxin